jgi:formylglycine-generating enzyme required for sulfatase activity
VGLVPIGADPDSGLWEFWHVESGDEPLRDRQGVLQPTEETGLIFVLLPGGEFQMGAQTVDPEWHNYDPHALGWEASVHPVKVAPFFLSKYEVTREQWARAGGELSFDEFEGLQPRVQAVAVTGVSWFDCQRLLLRIGCVLPTEEQWEYGCRGGSAEPRPFPADELAYHANVADLRLRETLVNPVPHELWDDGYGLLAPIAQYRPNPYGLYDVLGNAYEWVADRYYLYEDRYPLSQPTFHNSANRVRRGGSYLRPATYARSAARATEPPSKLTPDLGVRPALRLAP